MKLKKLKNQVIVVTGASSGIGLATARMAAAKGARLVLAARSEQALRRLTDEINRRGDGKAVYVVADVGEQEDVRGISRKAHDAYGGFDTWINNAGVGIFGKLEDTAVEDMRRLFDTNFWGIVYGSLEAAKYLRRGGGAKAGAIINVGSVVSERAIPLQGIYSTSKHAVKGFTDSLRMELEADDAPVSVTLIKPASINTPFTLNAKNLTDKAFTLPPPVYAPETVAKAILYAAETPVRDLFVGGGGKGLAAFGHYAPRLADKVMGSKTFINQQKKNQPAPPRSDNGLDRASEHLSERGDYEGHTMESSLYTESTMHPLVTGALVVGAGLAVAALVRRSSQNAK